jgi:hypothetical protein
MDRLPDTLALSSWLERLRDAHTSDEVVNVVRRFMFCVPPEDLERLPRECHDVSIQDAASLAAWAVTFRQAELTTGSHVIDGGLLQRISAILTAAAGRLSMLALGRQRKATN